MSKLLLESSLGVLIVLITGISATRFTSSETVHFWSPLIIGISWSAGLLYRNAHRESDSE